jgi:hypothetical protein
MQIAMDEVRRVQERNCEQREGHSDTIIDITPNAR